MKPLAADDTAKLKPRPRRYPRRLEIDEGKAEDRPHVRPGEARRRIGCQIDIGAVIAVEHHAGDEPEIARVPLDQPDRAIWLHRLAADLLHHPLGDGLVLRVIFGENQCHI